jgi:hypothetical protein
MSFMLSMSVTALAGSDIPDIKGTWVWKDQAVVHYRTPELPAKTHLEATTKYAEIEFILIIDKQEGFRFSGTKTSKKWTESVSGVIGFDNKTVYMVDDNGFFICRLVSPDKMEEVYLHATKTHSVAARGVMIRKR